MKKVSRRVLGIAGQRRREIPYRPGSAGDGCAMGLPGLRLHIVERLMWEFCNALQRLGLLVVQGRARPVFLRRVRRIDSDALDLMEPC